MGEDRPLGLAHRLLFRCGLEAAGVGGGVEPGAVQAAVVVVRQRCDVDPGLRDGPALRLGLYESISSLYSGGHPRASQLFSKLRFFGKALWLGILEAFFTFLWMLLFIVPGIIAIYRYRMALYVMIDHPELGPLDCLRESKRLMTGHAFECGARRAVYRVDAINLRSRAAVLKLGAVEEALLRQDRITWTGRIRDTVIFSVLDHEWPAVRDRLDARLATFTR